MTSRIRGLLGLVTAAACAALVACSSAPAPAALPPVTAETGSHSGHGGGHGGEQHGSGAALELWAVQSGPLGVVVTDGGGRLLYRSDRDGSAPPTSTCTGPCAATWEPVLATAGQQPVLLGVDETKVGTVARADGAKQVTLGGWPLYRRAGEPGGLQDAGANGADGVWFAVGTDGAKAATGS